MRARHRELALISIVVLALAASLTGVTNGFALDDVHIIVENEAVHSLSRWWTLFAQSYWPPDKGGDLYRPFTMLSFAVQWVLGNGSPLPFHLTSIALYALVCATFFRVALKLLPLSGAWLAGALFAVHPLHVESVANGVGQAELWAALFMILALGVYLRARDLGRLAPAEILSIAALYALACLSKEHALVLPLLLLAAELTVTPCAPMRARMTAIRPLILTMSAIGLAFLWVRIAVLATTSTHGAQPSIIFAGQGFGVRVMTMLSVVLEWVRLFFWPANLSADYTPQRIELVSSPNLEMLAGAAIVIGVAVVAWRTRRAVPVAAFAVLWVAVGLLIPSNLLVPTGFVLAERTLFLASGGVPLGVAAVASHFAQKEGDRARVQAKVVLSAIAAVLLVGLVASALRQRVWRDNATLFAQTVKDAPTSYNAHLLYSGVLFEQRRMREGFEQIRIGHSLYPGDIFVLEYAAEQYVRSGNCTVATELFRSVLTKNPRRLRSRTGLASCLIMTGDYTTARGVIRQGFGSGESETALRQLLHINDSVEASRRPR